VIAPNGRTNRGAFWLALGVALWCGWRLSRGIGPAPLYNSDSGVAILLAQGVGSWFFTLYYPAQDRLGGWPFWLARALHRGTPESFHAYSVLVLLSALVPLSRLVGGLPLAVLTLFPPLFLSQTAAQTFFNIGQPYLWQVAALCWAWWATRAVIEAGGGWRLAGLVLTSALAIWISPLSGPVLLGVWFIEAVRANRLRSLVPPAAIVLLGVGEWGMRRWQILRWLRRYGQYYVTSTRVDTGHLRANLRQVLGICWHEPVIVPLALGLALAFRPGAGRTERANQAVMLWLAGVTLPATILFEHFRVSEFSGRFFAFSAFWALAASTYGLATLTVERLPRLRVPLAAVMLAALALACPRSPTDPLAAPRADAARLSGTHPRVYLDGYWQTYVTASVAPPGALIPLPLERQHDRFPMLLSALTTGAEAIAPCALDRGSGLAEQYGALLGRLPGEAIPGPGDPLCLYRVERAADASWHLHHR
jgi:hypothetical protein